MKFTHFEYQLKNGFTIVTPHNKEITEEEYLGFYSNIILLLQIRNQKAYEKLALEIGDDDPHLLKEAFEAITINRKSPRELISLDGLSFIYIISYLIQKSEKELKPILAHLMARALMKWLPNSKLIESYLIYSADNGQINDACVLATGYLEDKTAGNSFGLEKNPKKALKYAEMAYNNFEDVRRGSRYYSLYAEALYRTSPRRNASKAVKILLSALEYNKDYPSQQLIPLLKILSSYKVKTKLNFEELETMVFNNIDFEEDKYEAMYWLAKCYISGKNCQKDVNNAIGLLKTVINNDVRMMVFAGIALCEIYSYGLNGEIDYKEAIAIADAVQSEYLQNATPSRLFFYEPSFTARAKDEEAKYVKAMRTVLQEPIHCANTKGLDVWLKFHLTDSEYGFLLNEYDLNNQEDRNKVLKIVKKIRHPVIAKKLMNECNRMVYLGENEKMEEQFLNFEESGNIFIHGRAGAGKTWFFNAIFKRLIAKQCYKNINMVFWSFKPFEFEGWCDDYIEKDPSEFINRIKQMLADDSVQKVVFIDEFAELLYRISDEDKEWFKSLMKTSKDNHITFICCSQNMATLINDYQTVAGTNICMDCCGNKEESKKMIGTEEAASIDEYGSMFVLNNKISPLPFKTFVRLS